MKNNITFYPKPLVTILLILILLVTVMLHLISTCFAQYPWAQKANMPTGRWELSTCVVDGKIYAIGGAKFQQALNTMEQYDPVMDTWITKSDMPTARTGLSGSVVGGKIYAIGGGLLVPEGKCLSTVEEYDPMTDTWSTKSAMPTERGWHSANVLDGKIYIIGGCMNSTYGPSGGEAIQEVDVYDPIMDIWVRKTNSKGDIPGRIGSGFTSVVDRKIYAFGGYGHLDKVHEYDPETDTWTPKTGMSTKRVSPSTSVVGKNIYIVGGHPGSGSPYQAITNMEVYDPSTDTWKAAPDMLIGRCGVRTSVVDDKIYAFGGYKGTWLSSMCLTVEEYDPSKNLLGLVENVSVNKGFMVAGSDNVCITAKINDPTGVVILAEIEAPDKTPIDSLQLFDDGNHDDGNADDSVYANIWPVTSKKEQQYFVDLHVTRIDADTVNHQINNMVTFTTIGPVVFSSYDITSSDTVPNPNDYLKFKFNLKNLGISERAINITSDLTILDTCASFSKTKQKNDLEISFGHISPGEIVSGKIIPKIYFSDSCTDGYYVHLAIEICSNGYHFWSDTVSIYVEPATEVDRIDSELPKQFALNQNYPNPFNPSTKISYSIPNSGFVKLKVYDMLGREVQTLVNKYQSAKSYSINFNAGKLVNGIYFYKLQTDDGYSEMKKMILLK